MAQRTYVLAAIIIGFVLILVYATFRSTTVPPGYAREEHVAATRECQRAVRESVADARFPFGANVADLQGDRLRLTGSMDSGRGGQAERQNFVCFMSRDAGSGEYVADSVEVWKSH